MFAPDPEVAQCAQRIVDVYAEAMEGGKGGITVDGQMVDEVTNKMAQEIVENGKATGTLN